MIFKNMILVIPLLALSLLAGCATDQAVIVQNKFVPPPAALYQPCLLAPPPAVADYMSAGWQDREDMLIKVGELQIKYVDQCNIRLQELDKWVEDQKKIYKDTTDASQPSGKDSQ